MRFDPFSAMEKYANGFHLNKATPSPWPPWRLPTEVSAGFADPRQVLQSSYAHGLIFNLLYKAVHGSLTNDLVISLSVHILDLALTFPKTGGASAGREIVKAVGPVPKAPSEPVDLQYDTWFSSDCLSSNLRQKISVIYTQQESNLLPTVADSGVNAEEPSIDRGLVPAPNRGAAGDADHSQPMEIDQVVDGKSCHSISEILLIFVLFLKRNGNFSPTM